MACSYADHFAGLGRRFRICGGTSRISGMITPGAVASAEIRMAILLAEFVLMDTSSWKSFSWRLCRPMSGKAWPFRKTTREQGGYASTARQSLEAYWDVA